MARRAVSAARPPTRLVARPPARWQRYIRRQTTDDDRRRQRTTDASEQNITGPLGGPVINPLLRSFLPTKLVVRVEKSVR